MPKKEKKNKLIWNVGKVNATCVFLMHENLTKKNVTYRIKEQKKIKLNKEVR